MLAVALQAAWVVTFCARCSQLCRVVRALHDGCEVVAEIVKPHFTNVLSCESLII